MKDNFIKPGRNEVTDQSKFCHPICNMKMTNSGEYRPAETWFILTPINFEGAYAVDDSATVTILIVCNGPKNYTCAENSRTPLRLLFSQTSRTVADPRLTLQSYPRLRCHNRMFVWCLTMSTHFQDHPTRSCFGKWQLENPSLFKSRWFSQAQQSGVKPPSDNWGRRDWSVRG